MTRTFWGLSSVLLLVSACATQPANVQVPEVVVSPPAAEKAAPKVVEKALPKVAPKVVKQAPAPKVAAPQVAAVPTPPVELPPSVFIDANAAAPWNDQVEATPAPAPTVVPQPVVVAAPVAPPAPAYVLSSPTTPQTVTALTAPVAPRVLPQAAPPQSLAPAPVTGPQPMNFVSKLEQSGGAPEGEYGFILIDGDTGQVISERNADTPMPPASIAKMLATIAILEAKGMNGTFRTSLLADGQVSGGVLNGDLHLVGTGDPSLNRTDLSNLARRLASAGVKKVNGRFYYHGDALPEVSLIDRNQSVGAIFNPGISGLNLDRNEHRGASPVKNPAKYTAEAMVRAAQSAGVTLPSPRKGSGGGRGNEIAAHDSAPVSAILTEMFDISRNMTAEVLGAAAAAQLSRKPTSLQDAARINSDWAKSRIGSIGGSGWSGFDFENNSGLSTRSKITPRQMAALTQYGYEQHGEAFRSIHEVQTQKSAGGVDFSIVTKFGTLSYVRGLTGIITLNGRNLTFAIMSNDPRRRLGNAKAWMDKARRLEQAVTSDWLQNNWPRNQQVASR